MLVYTFDHSFDGLLTAVFDSYALHQQPEILLGEGGVLPLFTEEVHQVQTADDKAQRVWKGLEKLLPRDALRLIMLSWHSELEELNTPLFQYIYKVFQQKRDVSRNFSDADVLTVTNIARKVAHEQLRMKQFARFQKAKDGTYLAVISPDHNVLPLVIDHFQDRFQDQAWLMYDAKRHYGYYYDKTAIVRVTFENESQLAFSLSDGRLNDEVLSENDKLFQELWRTYFKAICIRERMNPRKQLKDMPRRYWKYMTEKN